MPHPHVPWARLLLSLKVVVESLLERQVPDVWNVYGGLNRLCSALADILHHGYKLCNDKGYPDLWPFIQGLNWLQPSIEGCVSPGVEAAHLPEAVRKNKAMQWIFCHVENHSIAEKLSRLVSDREHLSNFYYSNAFLSQQTYAEATLICLKAVEQNQLSLLADVDPALYVFPSTSSVFTKSHRRCTSLPVNRMARELQSQDIEMPLFSSRDSGPERARVVTGIGVIHGSIPREGHWPVASTNKPNLKKSTSLPSVLPERESTPFRMRSETITTKLSPSLLKVEYPSTKSQRPKCRKKRVRPHQTFMEDGGTSVRQAATGYFPRPSQGQSLTSFLSSGTFTSADLDRENAHFLISEAMISAIEQVKCNQELRLVGAESDDSEHSRQKVVRRPRVPAFHQRPCGSWGDRADTTTSELTPSPPSSESSGSEEETAGSDAEQLALSLLRKFENKQLPLASELEWLVSIEDAPQELLPMPGGWPISPDEACSTPLRGTHDWAPPRPQVIFTPHPPPVWRVALAKQSLRCAGCGSKVAPQYASRFRYCEYLGRYFCTGCHTNQLAIIPGRVIANWDFNRYPVSSFSYRLLEQMKTDPLFCIDDLNPQLYKKVKALERTRTFRMQLLTLQDFLLTCRFADHLKELLTHIPTYSLKEPDRFSLDELCRVRTGQLPTDLHALVKTALTHVDTCCLCQGRGFICELCRCPSPIFPWSLGEVSRCQRCGSCFHKKCFKLPSSCPRCARMAARQRSKVS